MPNARTANPLPGISSRRFACDRCRVQKARCLREHASQTRCDRCVRADAECVTSPMSRRRSWQIIAYDSPDLSMLGRGTKKRQRRAQQDGDFLAPSESSGHFGTQLANSSHGTGPFQSDQPAALPSSSSILAGALPESSAQNATGNIAGFESMFCQHTDTSLEYVPEFGLPDGFFVPVAHAAAQTGPTSNNPSPESGGDGTPDSKDSGSIPKQDIGSPLQQLSRLDYELVTLLHSLEKGPPHVTMDTLISPIDNSKPSKPAVVEILNRTREFVDVLEAFSGNQASSGRSQSSHKSRSFPSGTNSGSSEMDHDTPLDSSQQSLSLEAPSSCSSSSPTRSDSQPTAALDTTALLAILTVYLRVLRLHLVIFANVYDFLKEISESDDSVLCPIPGLNFSSFPIQSGNLQTVILIQIVTSLFERLETLLGLPREFRIGNREREAPGLFGHQGFMKIASSMMRNEEVGTSRHGQGGVKALREYVKKTKQLLKENIAP